MSGLRDNRESSSNVEILVASACNHLDTKRDVLTLQEVFVCMLIIEYVNEFVVVVAT